MGRLQQKEKDFYLGYRFLTSLCTLLRLIYPRFDYAVLLTVVSIITAAGYEVVNYNSGTIIGKFYSALLSRDEPRFWNLIWKATLIYFGQTLLLATISFVTWLLYLAMRKNLVTALHGLYYRKNAYYQLNAVDNAGVDNPDQRITQDAERMCSVLAKNIFPYILISPGVIAYYTYKTWITAGPFGAGMIYVYFIIGVIANRILVSPLTKWTARVERCEGDFRYKHVTVRKNAEESAFYDAAAFDESESNRFLMRLLKRQLTAAVWKYPAQFLQNFFDYYGAILSYLVQVFPIFIFDSYKDMDPAKLSQQISNNAFFFIYLINSFTRLTDLALSLGEMAGYAQRIAELVRCTRSINKERIAPWSRDGDWKSPDVLVTENLCYAPPTDLNEELVSGLSLRLRKGKTLLITGASGVGKSSLFRVVRKLWEPRSGTITRNFDWKSTMFLPQRPYFPPGPLSLRQQIIFPRIDSGNSENEIDNNRMLCILQDLQLRTLISMSGGLTDPPNFEWQDTLSPGEQQRLSLARVLYHKPSLVFLDEATSSLSLDAESTVYELLRKNGISYVSTGHRQSLKALHDWELHLKGRNDWNLIEDESGSF